MGSKRVGRRELKWARILSLIAVQLLGAWGIGVSPRVVLTFKIEGEGLRVRQVKERFVVYGNPIVLTSNAEVAAEHESPGVTANANEHWSTVFSLALWAALSAYALRVWLFTEPTEPAEDG